MGVGEGEKERGVFLFFGGYRGCWGVDRLVYIVVFSIFFIRI